MSETGTLLIVIGSTIVAMATIGTIFARVITAFGNRSRRKSGSPEAVFLSRPDFEKAVEESILQARREGTYLSLIRVEIDALPAGSQAPQSDIANRMSAFLRTAIRGTDIMTHLSGGEFAILTPGFDESASLKLTDTLRHGVRFETFGAGAAAQFGVVQRHVTCCFGVASLEQTDNAVSFQNRAESALRHAQKHGANRIMGQSAAAAAATAVNF